MQTCRQAQATGGLSSSSSSSSAVNVNVGVTPQAESTNATQTQLSPAVSEPPKDMSKSVQAMLDGLEPKELRAAAKYIAVREAQQRLEANERNSYPPTLSTLSRLSVRYIYEGANEDGGCHRAIVKLDNETCLLLTWSIERWEKHSQQRTRYDWTIRTWSSSQDYDAINPSIVYAKREEGEVWFRAMHFDDCFEFEYEYETYPPLTAWRQKQSQVKEKSNKTKNNGNGNKVKASYPHISLISRLIDRFVETTELV